MQFTNQGPKVNICFLSLVYLPLLWWLETQFLNYNWWLKRFHVSKWQISGLQTPFTIYSNIFNIRILIQIKFVKTPVYKWIYQRIHSSHRKRKEGTSIRNSWVLCVFVLLRPSNLIMETEDNNVQRQVYNSYIMQVGAALSIRNVFLTLYCHKELHHNWCEGPISASG